MEQKRFTLKGEILERTRLNNSACGNPRAEVAVYVYDGEKKEERVIYAKTATNSAAGLMLGATSMGYLSDRKMSFQCHETKKGQIIIDQILSGYYDR